jgi:hypothetical protein
VIQREMAKEGVLSSKKLAAYAIFFIPPKSKVAAPQAPTSALERGATTPCNRTKAKQGLKEGSVADAGTHSRSARHSEKCRSLHLHTKSNHHDIKRGVIPKFKTKDQNRDEY